MIGLTLAAAMLAAGIVAIGWAARADQMAWRRRQALKAEWMARQEEQLSRR